MILIGTLVGLLSAGCTAVSYVSSRRFMTVSPHGSGQLTAASFTMMGVASLLMLPFFSWVPWPPFSVILLPLLAACGFFLIAQVTSFIVLRYVQASRISPLLGMKIIAIAILSPIFLDKHISHWQWIAVMLSVGAALLLVQIGGQLQWQAVTGVTLMVLCYSLSDLGIVKLVAVLGGAGRWAGILALVLIYILAGLFGLACMIRFGIPDRHTWRLALPYTGSWFCSAIFYFISLQCLGVVFAIIIQATRGLQSIALGVFLAHRGHEHLEEKTDRTTLVKRIAAAVLMVAAIILYALAS